MSRPKKLYLSRADLYVSRLPKPGEWIVCGDCGITFDEAGEMNTLPLKTRLVNNGRGESCCDRCGGRSFELASIVCAALNRTLQSRRKYEYECFSDNGNQASERVGQAARHRSESHSFF